MLRLPSLSPRACVIAVCFCAIVGSARFLVGRCLLLVREMPVEQQFLAKYAPLRDILPKEQAAEFMVDSEHADLDRFDLNGRFFLIQYAASPRLFKGWADFSRKSATVAEQSEKDANSRIIVVDSDRPEVVPKIASSPKWRLLADLQNGVRVYSVEPSR
jgi:hypothetical protein